MARAAKNKDTFVASFHHSHKFQIDIDGKSHNQRRGESVFGERFSPLPGYLFQLKILNLDSERFCVYLINCGEKRVTISKFKVKSEIPDKEAEKNNFSLFHFFPENPCQCQILCSITL